METAVDKHLTRRMARIQDPKARGFIPSLLMHGAVVGFVLLGPMLAPAKPKPIEVRPVMIVPVAALGVPNPPVRTQSPTPPVPQPEPPKPDPKPEPEKKAAPEPPKQDALVLSEKKKPAKKTPKPEPKPTPPRPTPQQSSPPQRSTGTGTASSAPAQRQGSARGNVAGTAAFGGAVGVDDPNFTYNYYIDQMLALISAQWRRPDVGAGIEAQIHFRLDRSGTVSEPDIRVSSGSSTFDLAAMRAVLNASPLPPLPGSYTHDSLGVNLTFR